MDGPRDPVPTPTPIKPRKRPGKGYLLKDDYEWTWQDLRDYVVNEMLDREFEVESDAIRESAIFRSFMKRWDLRGVAIARHVFEIMDGKWFGQPITINNFCKGQDPHFAKSVDNRL